MDVILIPLIQVILIAIDLYIYVLIASVILSWLVAFNVVNTHNQFVHTIGTFLHKATEPPLRSIRRYVPDLGGIDVSPIILILLLYLVQNILVQMANRM
ncbi:YggT family protein [Magnetospira thiophila]